MTRLCGLSTFVIVLMIGFWTCTRGDFVQPVADRSIVGSWLYMESGFSPGAGYIIRKVPLMPP